MASWDLQLTTQTQLAGVPVAGAVLVYRGSVAAAILASEVSYGPDDRLHVSSLPTLQASKLLKQFLGDAVALPNGFDVELSNGLLYWLADLSAMSPWLPESIKDRITRDQSVAGVNVLADMELTFADARLPGLAIQLGVAAGEGFDLYAQPVAPLSLGGFMTLSDKGNVSLGPAFHGRSYGSDRGYDVAASLRLLDATEGLDAAIKTRYDQNGEQTLAATMTATQLGPFPNVSLTLSWSQAHGYQISGFPAIGVPADFGADKFQHALKDIANKECSAVVDLVFQNLLTTKFGVTPHFTTTKPDIVGVGDGVVYLQIDGSYSIFADDQLVVTVPLPELALSIPAPSSFDFQGIVQTIGKAIVDNAEAIVQELWNQPQKLGIFLAVFVGKQMLEDVASKLLCKGLKELLEKFVENLVDAGSSVADLLGSGLAAIGGAAVGSGCGGGGGGGGGGSVDVGGMPAPARVTWAHTGDTVSIYWDPVPQAQDYFVQLWDPKGEPVDPRRTVQCITAGTTASVTVPDQTPAGDMKCSVIARSANPVLGESAAALPTPPITKLATPQTPSVGYDIPSNLLTVTWEPVAGASEYWLDVIDASDASVLRSLCLPATVAQATVAWADIPTTATACRLAIRAGGDASHLDSAATTEVTIQVLGAPAGLEAIYASPEDELSVRWTADPEATSHEVIVTDATGAALNPAPMIALAPVKGATISGPAIVAGSSYRVRARSLGVGHVATWSDWMTVNAQFVPAPKGVSLSYANRALIATWQAVPSATEYRVAISALATGAEVAALQTAATAAGFGQGTSITAGAVYVVAVRAQVATSVGPAGTAQESAPDLLAWLGNLHAQGTTADAAAMAARTFAPAAGPACLFAMLAAAGYPAVNAASGTTTQFPQADLTAEIAALYLPAVLAPILQAAGVGGPTIVAVTARLYAGLPVELAIQLRIGGLAQADVAAALPSACAGVSAADAMAIAGAAYVAPWALGGALHAAPVPDASVVPDLLSAYPALSAVEAAGTLKGAGYDLMHAGVVPRSLGAHYAAGDYADALEALADETGGALARLLHAAGVAADAATSYAAASFPTLTADAVQTAITAAYDTPQPT